MRKLILLYVVLVTFLSAKSLQPQEMTTDEMEKQNRIIVKLASEEMSKTLPQNIDKYTTLQKVEGKDTKLIYTYEINTGAKSDESVRNEDRSRMQKAVTYGICKTSKRFLDAKIDISYVYRSATSKEKLFEFNVSQKDCIQSDNERY